MLKALNTLPKKESRAITERLGLGESQSVDVCDVRMSCTCVIYVNG